MKLVIAEYLRSLKERDELDRLLPDLLVEMGFTPIAKPQTGNRQYGVDLAVRGNALSPEGNDELVLFVIKQGDIGREEWDSGGLQSVRQSINEIVDVYLKSHVELQDNGKDVKIIVATGGELKQTIQAAWSGYIATNVSHAKIDFWGADRIAALIEKHLLDEFLMLDQDRKDMRRALALSGDSDYDRKDLHRIFLRALDLTPKGELVVGTVKTGKALIKAIRAVNLAAQMFASWSVEDGDARLGILGIERALLWTFHRIQLAKESERSKAIAEAYSPIWIGYFKATSRYCNKVHRHFHVEDALLGYHSDGSEHSLVAFEQIGLLASVGLAFLLVQIKDDAIKDQHNEIASAIAHSIVAFVSKNGICSSPCLDRHSQDITLAMMLLILTGNGDDAKGWLRMLVRNVDYAFKAKRFVPISTDLLDDLVEAGGWLGGTTDARLMQTSWMLATLAGWAALLGDDDCYDAIFRGARADYPETCIQLWHADQDVYRHMYFNAAHSKCGLSEAPIVLPATTEEWRVHMRLILASEHSKFVDDSVATQSGIPLDIIAWRHFSTPIPPVVWYQLVDKLFPIQDNVILQQ
jgi:hypothetical protein